MRATMSAAGIVPFMWRRPPTAGTSAPARDRVGRRDGLLQAGTSAPARGRVGRRDGLLHARSYKDLLLHHLARRRRVTALNTGRVERRRDELVGP